MNGIDKITARIEADARAAAAETIGEAKTQCAAISAKYEKQAQELYDGAIHDYEQQCSRDVQRAKSAAAMDSKKQLLAVKQDAVSEAFDKAQQQLCSLPKDEYVAFLAKQAALAAQSGHEELIFNERDRSGVGAAVAEKANALLAADGKTAGLTVSDTTRSVSGGVILHDGDVEANCTVEALVALYRDELAYNVAGVLFG